MYGAEFAAMSLVNGPRSTYMTYRKALVGLAYTIRVLRGYRRHFQSAVELR